MVPVMIITAIGSGTLTALALWPALGAWALLAAPFGASLVVLVTAVLVALQPEAAGEAEPAPWLDRMTDRLVAELRRLAGPAEEGRSRPERRRKVR